jgi:hypothetical protein
MPLRQQHRLRVVAQRFERPDGNGRLRFRPLRCLLSGSAVRRTPAALRAVHQAPPRAAVQRRRLPQSRRRRVGLAIEDFESGRNRAGDLLRSNHRGDQPVASFEIVWMYGALSGPSQCLAI